MTIHITKAGETFDGLALLYYDQEKLANYIIEANPEYCDTVIFDAGTRIRIPDRKRVQLPETLPPWRR